MPANKDRLYIALHVRSGTVKMPSGEDKYHWSLLLSPKTEPPSSSTSTILHAKETLSRDPSTDAVHSTWLFEERPLTPGSSAAILARVCVAKVLNRARCLQMLRDVPLRAGEVPGWNCVGWVREALTTLVGARDVLGRHALGGGGGDDDWGPVRDACMGYVERKKAAHRYDGQAEEGRYDTSRIPTWDMLQGRETVP